MQLLNVYNHDHDDIDEVEDDPDDDDNQENNKYDDDGDDSSSQNEIQDEVDQESKYSYNDDDDYDHEEEDDPGEALFSGRINPYTTNSNSSSSSSRPVTTKVFKPARITDYFPVIPSSKRSTSTPTSKQPRNIPSHKKPKPQTTIRQAPTSEKNIKRQKKKIKRRDAKSAMESNARRIQLSNIVNNTNVQCTTVYSRSIETRKRRRAKKLINKKRKEAKLQHKCEDHS